MVLGPPAVRVCCPILACKFKVTTLVESIFSLKIFSFGYNFFYLKNDQYNTGSAPDNCRY